ncbi:3-oxoacyl-ACP reductase family protein [Paraburkholderia terricola]|uniref:3-oxoacyl-[acyl-carrier protein] reductase n=1 Tax=Paraburkholderia terricola TaxID=169427 RepID=A0ABU1M1E6_9BURK|nr:3-oxoacyl-ACP reductase family protein [Paraburkholderia terricola]MDR6412842.1 3-oxoacyl-[acyl-carrier protein] reductase [Paraburkholderia terricola]MDR6450050.1 3-oxoacyl-[acyl-carrier protein] reductase [Paraburkholderia terricola]MDR6484886.1 3-oxoacyl-[acyl-carrier protein] reductase [Paraburkholderia terricola]
MELKKQLCTGKTVLVTGAARGIGAAIAMTFAQNGANVVLNARTDSAALRETLEVLRSRGVEAMASNGNVADAAYVNDMVGEAIGRFGAIDILVNNAGIIKDKPIAFLSESDWNEVLGVNLAGAFYCSKAVVKSMMKRNWGRIINISSITALSGRPGQTNYGAAKAGLIGFTKSLAREVAPYNILVNTAVVGLIDTRMTQKIPRDTLDELAQMVPLKRTGRPEEVASVCLFLGSEMASYITGTEINVSGGAYI